MVAGQMKQQQEPGDPLHQGPDRGLAARAEDQITLPVTRHRPILGLGGPVGDADHALQLRLGLPSLGLAAGPAGTERVFDLLGQLASGPEVESLVDPLVRHPHLRIVREIPPQPSRDLLRTMPPPQAFHDLLEQATANHQLGRPAGPAPVLINTILGDHRPITAAVATAAVDLTSDRGPSPAQHIAILAGW